MSLRHRHLREDASLYDKGELALNQPFRHEGILGQIYIGELIKEVTIGGRVGVVSTLSGQAWITGYSTWVLDADDPFPDGFTVGDIWAPQDKAGQGVSN